MAVPLQDNLSEPLPDMIKHLNPHYQQRLLSTTPQLSQNNK